MSRELHKEEQCQCLCLFPVLSITPKESWLPVPHFQVRILTQNVVLGSTITLSTDSTTGYSFSCWTTTDSIGNPVSGHDSGCLEIYRDGINGSFIH